MKMFPCVSCVGASTRLNPRKCEMTTETHNCQRVTPRPPSAAQNAFSTDKGWEIKSFIYCLEQKRFYPLIGECISSRQFKWARINVNLYKRAAEQSQAHVWGLWMLPWEPSATLGFFCFLQCCCPKMGSKASCGNWGLVVLRNLGLTVLAEAAVQSSSCVGGSSRFSLQDQPKVSPELPCNCCLPE